MAHPVIEEMSRCYALANVQSTAFRRWQRVLRDEVQPLLDERERLIEENAQLREEILKLSKKAAKAGAAA